MTEVAQQACTQHNLPIMTYRGEPHNFKNTIPEVGCVELGYPARWKLKRWRLRGILRDPLDNGFSELRKNTLQRFPGVWGKMRDKCLQRASQSPHRRKTILTSVMGEGLSQATTKEILLLYLLLSHFPTLTWQKLRNEEGMEEIWYKKMREEITLCLYSMTRKLSSWSQRKRKSWTRCKLLFGGSGDLEAEFLY